MAAKQLSIGNANDELIVICAGCSAVKIDSVWLPYNWARFLIDIQKYEKEMRVSHGLCKSCAIEIYGPDVANIFDNHKKDNAVTV